MASAPPGEPGAAAGLDLGAVDLGSDADLAESLREKGPRLGGIGPVVAAVPTLARRRGRRHPPA